MPDLAEVLWIVLDMQADSAGFYDTVPVFDRFGGIMDRTAIGRCRTTGCSDWPTWFRSTAAIAANRYKAVNMAAARR